MGVVNFQDFTGKIFSFPTRTLIIKFFFFLSLSRQDVLKMIRTFLSFPKWSLIAGRSYFKLNGIFYCIRFWRRDVISVTGDMVVLNDLYFSLSFSLSVISLFCSIVLFYVSFRSTTLIVCS